MQQNQADQQLQEKMKHIFKQIKSKPLNCKDRTMNPIKCKNCVYNIGMCCDMYEGKTN